MKEYKFMSLGQFLESFYPKNFIFIGSDDGLLISILDNFFLIKIQLDEYYR